ncbi:serpin family protein, partial [Streptomyces sp. UH6]|uniref:serpin family protein n=1 Tax=Streptomyces sp. UH6 TaxID=2748379 RepID=UPI0015D47C9E
ARAARELMAVLDAEPALGFALGLWSRRTPGFRPEWSNRLPAGTHGVLTDDPVADSAALDAWARERTRGLIDRMPVPVREGTEMVLATALAMATEWYRPFQACDALPDSGPWRRGECLTALRRSSTVLDRLDLADTPHGAVTGLTVMGRQGLDVRLLLGEESMRPAHVLRAGLEVLERRRPVVRGGRLPLGEPGPGLEVSREPSVVPAPPTLHVLTVPFTVEAHHDLTRHRELFGLTTLLDTGQGHLPGVAERPLALGAAAQSATATFTGQGFRAAAVTAVGMVGGCAPDRPRYRVTEIEARFDRPFGFLAVHRRSGLVLAAGWVAEPSHQEFPAGSPGAAADDRDDRDD